MDGICYGASVRVGNLDGPSILRRVDLEKQLFYSIPKRFEVYLDDADALPWDVALVLTMEPGETVSVDEITIRRRSGGEPASAVGLRRLPLGRIVAQAVQLAAEAWVIEPSAKPGTVLTLVEAPGRVRSIGPVVVRGFTTSRRRNAVTPETRADALAAYEEHKAAGHRGPLDLTATDFGVSRSAVHNWIKQARDERQA